MNIMAVRWGHLYKGTPAEHALEDAIAALGVPYRTQFPGWKYGCRFFPDFFLPTLKLVIEVDDDSHDEPEKQEADELRTSIIGETWGARVVRIPNEKALRDPEGSLRAALTEVGLWPIPRRLPKLREALPPLRKAAKRATTRKERSAAKRKARRSPSRRRSGGRPATRGAPSSRPRRPPRTPASAAPTPPPAPQPQPLTLPSQPPKD